MVEKALVRDRWEECCRLREALRDVGVGVTYKYRGRPRNWPAA